jgi:hypothetical protein
MKIFKTYLMAAVVLFGGLLCSDGRTTVTNEMHAMSSIRTVIEVFKKEHGRRPNSWHDLKTNGLMRGQVLAEARASIGVTANYVILSPPRKIKSGPGEELIIVISKGPTPEGAAQDGSGKEVPGRYVIFEDSRGEIGCVKYSERGLRKWFSDAGMNIDDVVAAAAEDIAADEPDPQKVPRDSTGGAGSTPARTSTESPRDRGDSSSLKDEKRWQWGALILVVGILLVAAKCFRRKVPSQGQKDKE